MLQAFVGNVDFNSAIVLAVAFIVVGVITTTMIAKRRSRLDVSNEFELAKIKQKDAKDLELTRIGADREWKMKQLDQNLITSHKEVKS
jgi:hypothetical protein